MQVAKHWIRSSLPPHREERRQDNGQVTTGPSWPQCGPLRGWGIMQPHRTAPASPSGKISPTQGHIQGKGDAQESHLDISLDWLTQVFIFSHFPKTAPLGNAGLAGMESKKGLHKASRTGSGSALRIRSPPGFTPNQLCDLQQVTDLLWSLAALPPRWDYYKC